MGIQRIENELPDLREEQILVSIKQKVIVYKQSPLTGALTTISRLRRKGNTKTGKCQ